MVEALAKAGASLENTKNFTPLHLAAQRGQLEVVKTLVRCGANLNAISVGGTCFF